MVALLTFLNEWRGNCSRKVSLFKLQRQTWVCEGKFTKCPTEPGFQWQNSSATRKYTGIPLSPKINHCIGAAIAVSGGENKCRRKLQHIISYSCYDITLLILGIHLCHWNMEWWPSCVGYPPMLYICIDIYMIYDDKRTNLLCVGFP